MGKNIFEVIFPIFFWDGNFKTCLAFYFAALETLFLEHSNQEISNLEFVTVSSKIMCLSLFGCKEPKLYKQHIVQWSAVIIIVVVISSPTITDGD